MNTPGDGIKQPYCPAQRAARRFGADPFLVTSGGTVSFEEFAHRTGCFADRLRRDGIDRRDSVALPLPAGPDTLALMAAVWRMGAIALPLDPRAPAERVSERICDLGCRMTVVRRLPGAGETRLDEMIASLVPGRITQARYRHGRLTPALAVLTSGSGGVPKAAVLSLITMTIAAQRACRRMDLGRGGRYLLNLPLHHVSGLSVFMRCLEAGAQCLLPGDGERTVDAIVRTQPTHLSLVAAQLRRALEEPAARRVLRDATCVLMGGGPLPELLVQRALDAGVPLMNSYGMTETAAMTCATLPGADAEELQTAGRPLVQDTVRISEQGHVEIRGNIRFVGYLHRGELTRPGTWFDTGDLGHFDGHGRLCVDGRADRMFIVGGENVQPEAVEAELCRLPGVLRAIVVPVRDASLDHVPAAFVETAEGFDGEAILAACRQALPRHAAPRHVFPWPDEKESGIKPSPSELQRRAEALLGRK